MSYILLRDSLLTYSRTTTIQARFPNPPRGFPFMTHENSQFPPDLCVTDRRGTDRRKRSIPVAIERRSGKDRRATQGERRRQIDPTTCERDYSDEEIEFMKAMDQYKRDNRRPFPTWSEVLEVLRAMGYRKVAEPSAMPGLSNSLPPTADD
jgi:hypothetical protein